MIIQIPNKVPALSIKIDWKSYFLAFNDAHGGNPVFIAAKDRGHIKMTGTWLYPDGWGYNANSYQGPEYPAPDPAKFESKPEKVQARKDLKALKTLYWITRRRIVAHQLKTAEDEYTKYKSLESERSAPLFTSVTYLDEETNKKVTVSEPIPYEVMLQNVEFLKGDLEQCDTELKKLGVRNV